MQYKIKTTSDFKFGTKNILLNVGLVEFDQEGFATIDGELEEVLEMIAAVPDIEMVEDKLEPTEVEEDELGEVVTNAKTPKKGKNKEQKSEE